MTLIRERGGQEQRGSFSPSEAEETLPGGSAGGVWGLGSSAAVP